MSGKSLMAVCFLWLQFPLTSLRERVLNIRDHLGLAVYCGEGTTKVEWQRRRRRWRRCDPHPLKTVLLTLGILLGSWVYGIDGKPLIRSFGRSARSSFPMLRMHCSMTDAARDAILRRRQDGDVVIPSIKVFMAITKYTNV